MFIPIVVAGLGATTQVPITFEESGEFLYSGNATYKGQLYQNSIIEVEKDTTVTVDHKMIEEGVTEFSFKGEVFYISARFPSTTKVINSTQFRDHATVEQGAVVFNPATQSNYATFNDIGTYSPVDDNYMTFLDVENQDLWLIAGGVNVKKIDVSNQQDTIVEVAFAPRWAQADGVRTELILIGEYHTFKLNSFFELVYLSRHSTARVFSSDTTPSNTLIVASNGKVREVDFAGNELSVYESPDLANPYAVAVAPDGSFFLGSDSGLFIFFILEGELTQQQVISQEGQYTSFLFDDAYTFFVDQTNKRLIRMRNGDRAVSDATVRGIPANVVDTGSQLVVTYLDTVEVDYYNYELVLQSTVTGINNCLGGAITPSGEFVVSPYPDDYINIYMVTRQPNVVPRYVEQNIPINSTPRFTYVVDLDYATEMEVVSNVSEGYTITRNGAVFTGGLVNGGDTIAIELQPNENYYDLTVIQLVGLDSFSFTFRTEPQTFPDSVVLDPVLDAFPNRPYYHVYEIEGLTEGFTATISSGYDNIKFRPYVSEEDDDGSLREFTRDIIVEVGDLVEVQGYVASLVESRTVYNAYSNDLEVIAWTMLPMLLNGSTKGESSQVSQDISPELHVPRVEEMEEKVGYLNPVSYEYSNITGFLRTSNYLYSPEKVTTVCGTQSVLCDTQALLDTAFSGFYYEDISYVDFHVGHLEVFDTADVMYVMDTNGMRSTIETVLDYESVYVSTKAFLLDVNYTPLNTTQHHVTLYGERYAAASIEVSVEGIYYSYTPTHINMSFIRHSAVSRYSDVTYEKVSNKSVYEQTEYVKHNCTAIAYASGEVTATNCSSVKTPTLKVSRNPSLTFNEVSGENLVDGWKVERGVNPIVFRTANEMEALDNDGFYFTESGTGKTHSTKVESHGLTHVQRHHPDFNVPVTYDSVRTKEFDQARSVGRTSVTITATPYNATSSNEVKVVSVVRPEPIRAVAFTAGGGLPTGFFATESEAIAYGMNLGITGYGEETDLGWIFKTDPTNDEIVCTLDSVPVEIRGRFGYQGGG